MAKIRRYHASLSAIIDSFIIQHIDNKIKFEEKILSTRFLFLLSLVKMLKFTSIVGYTSCGPTYIENFLTIFGQCTNVLNYKRCYSSPYAYAYAHGANKNQASADFFPKQTN